MKLRFAPSPTGLLHVGNARVALANYLLARRHGGGFLLRFDDTDAGRNRPEFVAAIEQDLAWLGIAWDESFSQSARLDAYADAAKRLEASGRLYPCFESEAELQAKRDQRVKRRLPPVYDRAMLRLTAEQRANAEAGGKKPYWRFRLSDGAVGWQDLVLGARSVKLPTVSDPVLIRADGTPLYTFTSVVDDLASGITHIIRGEDHVTNTAVQLDLWSALGGNPSTVSFAHLPLLIGDDGGKLSKREGALSLRGLRQDGVEPMAVTSFLARLGTSDDPAPLPLDALAASFDLTHFGRASPRFDVAQLLALNRRGTARVAVRGRAGSASAGVPTPAFWAAVRRQPRHAGGGGARLVGRRRRQHRPRPWWRGESGFLRTALGMLPAEPWTPDIWAEWTGGAEGGDGAQRQGAVPPAAAGADGGETAGPRDARVAAALIGRARGGRKAEGRCVLICQFRASPGSDPPSPRTRCPGVPA